MSQQHEAKHPIVPRERLNFHLDDKDIPTKLGVSASFGLLF